MTDNTEFTTYDDIMEILTDLQERKGLASMCYQLIANKLGISERLAYSLCEDLVKQGKLVKLTSFRLRDCNDK